MQQENHKLLRAFAMATNAPLEPGVYNEASHLLVNCTFLTNKRTILSYPVLYIAPGVIVWRDMIPAISDECRPTR